MVVKDTVVKDITVKDPFPVDHCLKCSTCNTVCPVYAVESSFAGPKYIGPELARFSAGTAISNPTVEYCTGCRKCEMVCPAGVKISLLAHRAKALQSGKKGKSLRDMLLGHNQIVSRIASLVTPLTNLVLQSKLFRMAAEKTLGVSNRPFPRYQAKFRYTPGGVKQPRGKVVYFIGCYGQYISPATAQATAKVLEACGIEVVIPPQKCCGVPLLTNGLEKVAEKNANYNLQVLSEYINRGYNIITSCPSCTLSLKQEYVEHFNLPGASGVAAKVSDVSQFLLELDSSAGLGLELKPVEKHLFYHQACHTRAQGMGIPVVNILKLIPGLQVETREQQCCGQAGTYGFKKEKLNISENIGKKLFQDVHECQVEGIITECGACGMQLAQGTGQTIYHPMEIISKAL